MEKGENADDYIHVSWYLHNSYRIFKLYFDMEITE